MGELPVSSATLERIQQDDLAMSVARALQVANETALLYGAKPSQSLVTISEETSAAGRLWRVHYGPRDYVHRRGGDLTVVVAELTENVVQVIRGQ